MRADIFEAIAGRLVMTLAVDRFEFSCYIRLCDEFCADFLILL